VIANRANRVEEYSRGFMMDGGTLFEELGFYYVGPDRRPQPRPPAAVLKNVRDMETGPILVHVVTQKGKGYPAGRSLRRQVPRGRQVRRRHRARRRKPSRTRPAYQNVFGQSLVKEAQKDDKIVGHHRRDAVGHRRRHLQQGLPGSHLRRRHCRAARR
jgi:1-deoxy-D-xylulose-5-phosphate synthase